MLKKNVLCILGCGSPWNQVNAQNVMCHEKWEKWKNIFFSLHNINYPA